MNVLQKKNNMLKKILILLFLIPVTGLGQMYSVEYHFHTLVDECEPVDPSFTFLDIVDTVSGSYQTLAQANCEHLQIPENAPETTFINFHPDQVRIGIGLGDGSAYSEVPATAPLVFPPASQGCLDTTIQMATNGGIVWLSLIITPLNISITPDTGEASSCDKITLVAPAYYDSSLYNWQYSVEAGPWTDLPAFQGIANIEVGIEDIPGLNINQNVNFRMRYCELSTSGISTFHFIKCSPDIINLIPDPVSCSYNNDGGFTVTFSESLAAGETLLLNLFQSGPPGDPGAILIATPVINSGDLSGNSYVWPENLGAGEYYLSYQLDNDGSVYQYGPFEIMAPAPVTFEVIAFNNVNCFNEATGTIALTAGGGTGSYQYELNNTDNWIDFTETGNPANHTITILGAGTYLIRVRDSSGCIAKSIE